LSFTRTMFKRWMQQQGLSATLHTRTAWTGTPTLVAAGAGGSIPAGTYWGTVVAIVGGADKYGGGKASVTCVLNDKVVWTWTKHAGATGYKLYWHINPSFPTPALLATVGDVATYTDTAGTVGAGSPDTNVTLPYVYFTDSTIKTLQTALVRQDQMITSGGILVPADLKLAVEYSVSVTELDEITYNSVRHQIQYVNQPVIGSTVVYKELYCKRMVE